MTNNNVFAASSFALPMGSAVPADFADNFDNYIAGTFMFIGVETGDGVEFDFDDEDMSLFLRACEKLGLKPDGKFLGKEELVCRKVNVRSETMYVIW